MTEDPAGDLLAQVRAKYPDRFRTDANPPNIYWFFLNHSIKPFSSLEVRRAVNYAIDSRALQRVFGGLLQPTCNFLPPAYAGFGYRRIDPCPYGDPAGPGDVAKARRLVDASGHKGEQVTVWGFSSDPVPQATEYLRDVLTRIGFKAKTRIVEQKVYFATVGARHTKAQAGFAAYIQDFPHPADFLQPLLSTSALANDPTPNFQMHGNPDVDRALEQLGPQSDPAKVAGGWARADRSVIEHADVAVLGNQLSTTFFSTRMNAKSCSGVHLVYKHDWSMFCLK
jgi:peptide/nickel transport system substrate-binding protein